jgi:DNA-binding SARP family transcriptional activator
MEFRILGPLEVGEGDAVVPLAGSRQRALLAILLLNANEVVSADHLIDELWGEESPGSGRTALQVRVSQLRKALGAAGALIETRPPGYVLRLKADQLDLYRFERLVADADTGDPAAAATKLRAALDLWRGPPLGDLMYDSFAQASIARLEELRLAVLEKRIEADLELARHADLVAELEELVGEHPLRERLWAQLMLALYRSGRQADALATYQRARRTLVEELGIEPGPQLRELEQAILDQDRSLGLAPVAAPRRSLLVVPLEQEALPALLAISAPLARGAGSELVLTRLIAGGDELGATAAILYEHRELLLAAGIATRAAAFTTARPSDDVVRLAAELDCELLLVSAPSELLRSPVLSAILTSTPCDVAALVGGEPSPGPLLVPFVGAEHDWTAIELGARLSGAWRVPLLLAGPATEGRDSSRLLASASLAVQRSLGIAAEPLLLRPGAEALVDAARDASLVVAGLSDRWQRDGLGTTRTGLAASPTPVLLVRRGLRPGGLAPRESLTRFTWSLKG